ncbi:Helix-turn-helix domain-containing protein [Butyrivibrio sp. INlla18]|nr:Helix-turn-helix domain-containing protein [Butyrivibrio sp. INlla18]
MTDLEKRILEIKKQYGDYLTQREFMEAAGISSRTAYLATKRGLVPYTKRRVGTVRYYRIRVEDVARYMEKRFQSRRTDVSPEKIRVLTTLLSSEPDVLSIRQASMVTGIHKNSIAKWIDKGYLKSFRWKGDHRITKVELIRYMASGRYWKARSRSLQRQAIRMAMEWLDTQHTRFERKEKNHDINTGSDR